MVQEPIDVGDGFECLHGGSPILQTKKAADPGGRAGTMGEWFEDIPAMGGGIIWGRTDVQQMHVIVTYGDVYNLHSMKCRALSPDNKG